jgi:hypothetical protein
MYSRDICLAHFRDSVMTTMTSESEHGNHKPDYYEKPGQGRGGVACMSAVSLARHLLQTHPLSQRPRYTTTR